MDGQPVMTSWVRSNRLAGNSPLKFGRSVRWRAVRKGRDRSSPVAVAKVWLLDPIPRNWRVDPKPDLVSRKVLGKLVVLSAWDKVGTGGGG